MERTILSRLNRYAVALLVVLAAAGVRLLFTPWISSQVPFLTFYVAVMVASWLGGLGPGLFAAGRDGILEAGVAEARRLSTRRPLPLSR